MVARLGQGLLLHDPFLLAEEVVLGEAFVKVELGEGTGVHTAFGKTGEKLWRVIFSTETEENLF